MKLKTSEMNRDCWCANGGAGNALNILRSGTLRKALLAVLTAGAMVLGAGHAVQAQVEPPAAQCEIDGSTVTCTGDVSDGVLIDNSANNTNYATLNVNDLTAGIAPDDRVAGIRFTSNGDVTIISDTGDFGITTSGAYSDGIYARSYGNGAVTVMQTGDITTSGAYSDGIYARSYGNGAVTVTQTGDITTADTDFGLLAYSVGGAVTVTVTGDINATGTDFGLLAYSTGNGAVTVTVTGDINATGDRNDGIWVFFNGDSDGAVTVTQTGDIKTDGDRSQGILARSTGNGAVTVTQTGGITTLGADSGGIVAYSTGNGAVTVTQTGDIKTDGAYSDGIFARSTGDGAVTVMQTGDITTLGADSEGIVAYSTGNGAVTVTQTGDIKTDGIYSQGIFTTTGSIGGDSSVTLGASGIALDGSTVTGSTIKSEQSEGVEFFGAANNTLTVYNEVTISGGATDILGGSGNERIKNHGTLTTLGSIDLGGGANAFNNMEGAVFNSGTSVTLGAGNVFTNWGDLSPGGADGVQTTVLTGDFQQEATGTFTVTLDGTASDQLNVTGTATLNGTVSVTGTPVFDHAYAILTADDGVAGFFDSPVSTLFVEYALNYDDPSKVDLKFNRIQSFSDVARTANQQAVANGLDRLPITNNVAVQAVLALTTEEEARAFYEHLSPEVFQIQQNTLASNMNFNNAMLSCRQAGGDFRFVSEGECGWIAIAGRFMERDRTSESVGFDETAFGIEGGYQKAVTQHWSLGFGLSYENTQIDAEDLSATDGDKLGYGLIAKGRFGAATVSAALSGGQGWYATDRFVFPGTVAESEQRLDLVSGHLRASYLFEPGPDWYWLPMVDVGVTHLMFGGFTETGARAVNLTVFSHDDTYFSVQPAIEIGGEVRVGEDALLRPFIKVGLTQVFGDTSPEVSVLFQGSPAGVAPFTVTGDVDTTFGDVEVGAMLLKGNRVTLKLNYTGQFSGDVRSHGGSLKVTIPF